MKISRLFLFVVSVILFVAGVFYYAVTQTSFFEKANAENVSTTDVYLSNNYGFTLGIDKKMNDSIRVYCDPLIATSTNEQVSSAYPCQNQNPAHKVLVGWMSSSNSYMATMQALGNSQLFWKKYPNTTEEVGVLQCVERSDYRSYKNAKFGMDCITTTLEKEKLYTSVMFFQGSNKKVKVVVLVMNTSKVSTPQNVDLELLALISKQKESTTTFNLKTEAIFSNPVADSEAGSVQVSSELSNEGRQTFGSNSSNVVTQNSGGGIDATVCDAVDVTSCYPLYCDSITGVWNYTINRCVEPEKALLDEAGRCPKDLPVWDGSRCRVLTGDIIKSNTCFVAVGENSCRTEVFWSVEKPKGLVEIRRSLSATEVEVVAKGQSGTVSYTFPYQEAAYTLELYDGQQELNSGSFITKCEEGGWDDVAKKCVNPQVIRAWVTGEYYVSPGSLNFICSNSDSYVVKYTDTNTIIATGTYIGEARVPIEKSGNYSSVCKKGEYTSKPEVRYYNAPPPPPSELFFLISPRTVSKGEKLILNWSIRYPRESCALSAKVVCKNNICSTTQLDSENEINQILLYESTDEVDGEPTRPITEAVSSVPANQVDKDLMAIGQKSLTINHTTDFTLSCGSDFQQKKRVYIRTNVSSE